MSTITALSFSVANLYASPAVARAERSTTAAPSEPPACDGPRPGGHQNRLAQAMMSALRELGFGGGATAVTGTATPTPTPTATATATVPATAASATDATAQAATEPAATAASAVYQFAHELFQALRQDQRGRASSDGGAGRVEGDEGHGHHHHHRHHNGYHRGEQREGYGDLSQRLESLSQTFGTPAAASTTGVALAGASAAATELPTAGAAAEPAVAPTVAPAVISAKNPLLEAFSKLFSALKLPSSAGTTATAAATSAESDMSGKLRLFLHTLAVALRPDVMAGAQVSQIGGLVNVTA